MTLGYHRRHELDKTSDYLRKLRRAGPKGLTLRQRKKVIECANLLCEGTPRYKLDFPKPAKGKMSEILKRERARRNRGWYYV